MITFSMAVDVRAGIDMGKLVRDALRECDMQHTEAYLIQQYPNASQFSKALAGDAPLDLWRMRHLPVRFWRVFMFKLAAAVIEQFWEDVTQSERKAS